MRNASAVPPARRSALTVLIMQVPCCQGLLSLAKQAAQTAKRKVPIKYIVVGIQGDILQEEWVLTKPLKTSLCPGAGRSKFNLPGW